MFRFLFTRIAFKSRIGIPVLAVCLSLFIGSCTHTRPSTRINPFTPAASKIRPDQPLPLDPAVTVGKLENGIRYYIRKNADPANRADLRLVINAGSVLEDKNQRGLAHFIEHMAFQGTEHFKKQAIIDYMESIGMEIGSGINASTGIDETVYMLQLPTDEDSHMVTALRILRDWATGITFDPEEIESERKVVIEEWRRGQGAQSRIRDKVLPVILKDSLYARRLPIGTLESLQNFSRDDLLRFYRDWYRPDLMAVIAVGDFDTKLIEKLIHEQFDSVPPTENPRKREQADVPEQNETRFVIATDPEVQTTEVAVYHKFPNRYDWTAGGHRQKIVELLYNAMLNVRFNETARKPDPPFMGASSAEAAYVRPLRTHVLQASVRDTGIGQGLKALLVESDRVARFGFTKTELDRLKTSLMRSLDLMYTNRDSRTSASHAAEMIRSFLTGEPIPGIEFEVALNKRFIPGITLEEVNRVGKNWIEDPDRVVVIAAPQKSDLTVPSVSDLKAVMASAARADIKPYEDTSVKDPLLARIPAGSGVTGTREMEGGLTEWKLANGITVILKPTDFKKDEILFYGFSKGGASLAEDADYIPAKTATTIIANGGAGNFNLIDLQKKLAGKVASVTPLITEYEEAVTGNGSPEDLETLFQLIYLRMTAPRADETFYRILKTQLKQMLENRDANPATVLGDAFNRVLYSGHFRTRPPSVEMLDKMDLAKSLAFYRDRFADAGDFVFIFVGSIDPGVMKPLVETYLGALPDTGRKETWKDRGIRATPRGIIKETVRKGQDPKSTTRIALTGDFSGIYNINERTQYSAAAKILQNRLRDKMRELLGGTYDVGVVDNLTWCPVDSYLLLVNFTSDPARVDELTGALFSEIKSLKETGPTEKEVADIKQALVRSHETELEQNAYWLKRLRISFEAGVHPDASQVLLYPDSVKTVNVESVHDIYKKYYDLENYIKMTLLPEK